MWTDPDSSVTDIRASILSNAGVAIVSDILVNTTTAGEQNEASVVALADGGFLVSWEDDNADLVRAQRFDAVGHKIGAEFTVKNGISPAVGKPRGRRAAAMAASLMPSATFQPATST